MNILSLIPARSGSKGVPGKNIRLLAGKPLIVHTIEAALTSTQLNRVVVSTDSAEIADIARSAGAEVPFLRPTSLAQDDTPTLPVIRHALDYYEAQGSGFDAVCLLQPTTPFRKKGLIDMAVQMFENTGSDSLLSVIAVPHEFNPHWVFELNTKGYLRLATGESEVIPRRQELPKAFVRDGAIYLTRTEVILNQNSLYGEKIAWIENDPDYCVNIDTLEDFKMAERKAELLLKETYR